MVNANIENDTVFLVLSGGESVTVPSNETWKVKVTDDTTDGYKIDGNRIGNIDQLVLSGNQTLLVDPGPDFEPARGSVLLNGFIIDN